MRLTQKRLEKWSNEIARLAGDRATLNRDFYRLIETATGSISDKFTARQLGSLLTAARAVFSRDVLAALLAE